MISWVLEGSELAPSVWCICYHCELIVRLRLLTAPSLCPGPGYRTPEGRKSENYTIILSFINKSATCHFIKIKDYIFFHSRYWFLLEQLDKVKRECDNILKGQYRSRLNTKCPVSTLMTLGVVFRVNTFFSPSVFIKLLNPILLTRWRRASFIQANVLLYSHVDRSTQARSFVSSSLWMCQKILIMIAGSASRHRNYACKAYSYSTHPLRPSLTFRISKKSPWQTTHCIPLYIVKTNVSINFHLCQLF